MDRVDHRGREHIDRLYSTAHGEQVCADSLEVMAGMPERSVDLVLGSPPYCDARTYDDGTLPEGHIVSRECEAWVEWMLEVSAAALRVSRGPVVWIAAGVTRNRAYCPACERTTTCEVRYTRDIRFFECQRWGEMFDEREATQKRQALDAAE